MATYLVGRRTMSDRSKPTPDAFLSYTRFNDRYDGGKISTFRERLSDAMQAVTGRPFHIFQDVDGIGLGENWRSRLNIALGDARFFIPILTPSFFGSEACRGELETFLQFERESGRDDLVLPIYWLRCPVLERADLRDKDPLARIIAARQRWDWRDLRHRPYDQPEVLTALEALADQIEEARVRVMPPPSIPRDRKAVEEAERHQGPAASDPSPVSEVPEGALSSTVAWLAAPGDDQVAGCAFMVRPDMAFTCAHVIRPLTKSGWREIRVR